jgi:hypothetical protein
MQMEKQNINGFLLGMSFCLLNVVSWGQVTVTNKGVSITNTQSSIYFNGDYIHDSTSTIANGGSMYFRNNVVNTSNNRMFVTDAGRVVIDGNQLQTISGDSAINFYKLEINKASNNLILSQNIRVSDTLNMVSGNIDLNTHEIDLGTSGELYNETENSKVFATTGKIIAIRYIDHPKLSENIAGLGLFISADELFSNVLIVRGHEQQTSNGDTSIFRYYNFIPQNAGITGLIDTLKFSYFTSETVQGEYLYKVYASLNDATNWSNKGGLVDTANNFVITTTIAPPELGKFRASIFPIESFATCLPNDPNFISAVFLVSTNAIDGDSVRFIQLTNPVPTDFSWNFGDGDLSNEYSPIHIYNLSDPSVSNQYQVTMTVTNGLCSDTRKKNVTVNPATTTPKLAGLFNGIEYFNLYPNPNDGNFNLEVKTTEESDIYIHVMDMQGKLIDTRHSRTASFKNTLNYQSLKAGLYFVKLQVAEEIRVIKMIIY